MGWKVGEGFRDNHEGLNGKRWFRRLERMPGRVREGGGG